MRLTVLVDNNTFIDKYFSDMKPLNVHACHCTDFQSKVALSKVANLQEVGVGLMLEYK